MKHLVIGAEKMKRLLILAFAVTALFVFGTTALAAEIPPEEGTTAPVTEPVEQPETPSLPPIFQLADDVSFAVQIDGETVDLYEKSIFIDANGDGKYNTSDSRLILRTAVRLEDQPETISSIDFNCDGKITTADARHSLRYNLHLLRLYCDKNGMVYSGFLSSDENALRYFDEIGGMAIGYTKIEDDYYYFDKNGIMQTGKVLLSGVQGYFDEDGKGANGFADLDGERYYFVNGKALTGLQTIDGKKYLFLEDGTMATGSEPINGQVYYFNDDGSLRDGVYNESGNTYFFQDGKPVTGWFFDGLNAYYYDTTGKRLKNTTSGSYRFDANGIATATTVSTDTLPVYLRGILKQIGTSPSAIYTYVHNNFRYRYYDKLEPEAMAVRILRNGRGACYDYAYLAKFLLEAAGYEARVVVGESFNYLNGNEHDWVLYKADGVWRYMDTQRGVFSKTAAQMRSLGYRWNASGLPETL